MYYIQIHPPKFNSNIYVFRQHISNWLDRFIDIRNNLDLYHVTPDDVVNLDTYLKQYHHRFVEVKNTIQLLELNVETYHG